MKLSYDYDVKENFEMRVTTFFGLEEILAKELVQLGGQQVTPFKRGVSVVGDMGFLYKANLCLHTALKVLVPITKFKAANDTELYDAIKGIEWEKFITVEDRIMVEAVLNSELYTHSLFVSQKIKDGIVDRFRDKVGLRPDVDLLRPTFKIYAHIFKDEVNILLDSSGEPLYKRGYRTDINEAPIKEVLAAGLVKLSGWERHQVLIDGMCGSGTIGIEAALWAENIPPGYYRNDFTCMLWKNFDENLYEKIHESAVSRIREDKIEIIANDISGFTLSKAAQNIKNAKVDDVITTQKSSFFDITPSRKSGVIILNPPYGERMPVEEIETMYKEIGNKLKKDFGGYTAWIITSSPEAINAVGLRATRRIHLYNGSLECRYLKYDLYAGSKKASKQPSEQPKPTE